MEPEKLTYFDCHSHVLDIPTQYQEQVLQTAYDGNIHHIAVNTTSSEQYDAMRNLEEKEEGRILAGFGIHPLFVYK
jgi:Tat protein secretion system quality control protein TatD with DNase activity